MRYPVLNPHPSVRLSLLLCPCSRFQPVTVPEPSIEETYEILQGLRERYEAHHKLRYTGEQDQHSKALLAISTSAPAHGWQQLRSAVSQLAVAGGCGFSTAHARPSLATVALCAEPVCPCSPCCCCCCCPVFSPDESLMAAAKYSSQYISDRFLPDKAIDLIDEAGSRVRLRHIQLPEEVRGSRAGQQTTSSNLLQQQHLILVAVSAEEQLQPHASGVTLAIVCRQQPAPVNMA